MAMPNSRLAHHLTNIAVAGLWVYFTAGHFRSIQGVHGLTWDFLIYIALLLRNGSLAALFLFRRPPKAISMEVKEWSVAIAGTILGVFYVPEGTSPLLPSYTHGAVYFLMVSAVIMGVFAILSLGWSFGIVPANRGIKTKGLYLLVRHPIYALYILFDLAFVCIAFSWHNLTTLCGFVITCYLRAVYEERLLRQDPLYREYAEKTRYMFIKGIL